jgi:hypothetical protein
MLKLWLQCFVSTLMFASIIFYLIAGGLIPWILWSLAVSFVIFLDARRRWTNAS